MAVANVLPTIPRLGPQKKICTLAPFDTLSQSLHEVLDTATVTYQQYLTVCNPYCGVHVFCSAGALVSTTALCKSPQL